MREFAAGFDGVADFDVRFLDAAFDLGGKAGLLSGQKRTDTEKALAVRTSASVTGSGPSGLPPRAGPVGFPQPASSRNAINGESFMAARMLRNRGAMQAGITARGCLVLGLRDARGD